MTLYWHVDFETGNLSQVETVERCSSDYGWGVTDTSSVVSVVSTPVYGGLHAGKNAIPAVGASAWRAANYKMTSQCNTPEAYFGFAVYFPSANFALNAPGGWANVFQLQEHGGGYRLHVCLGIYHETGQPLTYDITTSLPSWEAWTSRITLPLDRWIPVVVYLKTGTVSGNCKVWLDGVQIVNQNHDFSSAATNGTDFACGVYCGDTPSPLYAFFDELRCASTLAEATPVSGPTTQHSLSIMSNPSGLPFTLRKTA